MTDIQMQGSMDGPRLAQYGHNAYPPIILIIAFGAVRPLAVELQVDAIILPKPIETRALLERIDAFDRSSLS